MMRIFLLPLLLFTLTCMGQTFQYSRGWTNGKRSFHREEENSLPELYEFQEIDHKLERCLVQLQRFVHNPLLYSSALSLSRRTPSTDSGSGISNANDGTNGVNNNNHNNHNDGGIGNVGNSNSNNNLFESHHQSPNELFEKLNAAVETNDYERH